MSVTCHGYVICMEITFVYNCLAKKLYFQVTTYLFQTAANLFFSPWILRTGVDHSCLQLIKQTKELITYLNCASFIPVLNPNLCNIMAVDYGWG